MRITKLLLVILIFSLSGCLAPRSNLHSGKVTPHKHFKVGHETTVNVPSSTSEIASNQALKELKQAQDDEGNYEENTIYEYSRLVLAQSLDPIGLSSQFYVRYGLMKDVDFGLAYGSAGFIYDGAYQILHHNKHGLDGSIGVQYSSQSYELPSLAGDVQELLGYTFDRSDILLRATLSVPFGPNEEYGAFGFGLAINRTSLEYGFSPSEVSYISEGQKYLLSDVPQDQNDFMAYGGFVNIKAGYRYIYVVASLSVYYQDYGQYSLLEEQKASLDGVTIVPSLGLQGSF